MFLNIIFVVWGACLGAIIVLMLWISFLNKEISRSEKRLKEAWDFLLRNEPQQEASDANNNLA